MESLFEPIWVDLGYIGHQASFLENITQDQYESNLPVVMDDGKMPEYCVFIDYAVFGNLGTKVLTNVYKSKESFFEGMFHLMVKKYASANKPLDFKSDF